MKITKTYLEKNLITGVCFFFLAVSTQAQNINQNTARTEVLEAYKKSEMLGKDARKSVFKSFVRAHWLSDSKSFWYKNELPGDQAEYIFVNAKTGIKKPAFDQRKMADALSKLLDTTIAASKLPISEMKFDDALKSVYLKVKDKFFKGDLNNYQFTTTDSFGMPSPRNSIVRGGILNRWERQRESDSLSPDKQWLAYSQQGNMFVKSIKTGSIKQYTFDGDTTNPYGQMQWSPDSKHLIVFRIRPVEIKNVYYVLSSVPGTTRGVLKSHEYAQPGDPFTSYEMYAVNLELHNLVKIKTEIYDFLDYPWIHWREGDNNYLVYEKADRGHQRFRMIEVNVSNGDTRNLIDEKTNTFIYENRIFTWYTKNTNEIIWSSEKDGWYHLYLVDAVKGGVKNKITDGDWVVRGVDSIDEKKRQVWFRASGMNEGEDPYNIHYYRIDFSGKNLVALTPAHANHTVSFSPDRKYFIDTYSRPDLPPTTELRSTTDGKLITILEKADLTEFDKFGLKMPEVFVAKGRDGVTDIWGIVFRPTNFDPSKKYPVIENIYAGPQDSYVPKNFMPFSEMQSMAELGFIVVQCDGMGTANRSKAFHDVAWKNLADGGFPDRILWIKALAQKYPYVDATRVGLFGTSAGGQNSLGALLFHPEFYKAAVSAAGCHDNRVDKQWWNEQWMGYPVGPHYGEQSNVTNAHKLKGALLLIVGEADNNVPPESTLRVVDALIKSKKTFDLLVVPGADHGDGGPYGRMRKRDFFVQHLLGIMPPDRNNGELNSVETD